ncbi:MAG: FIST C-terminal domain-containing protein [Planctomycetes bacterium]|nr:FIST C-terminal domain-containing protein [Planctomycetota bacterium]
MQVETFSYDPHNGWSVPQFPALDSDRTLVLVFGASSFAEHGEPIAQLAAHFAKSTIAGCSSAGEILGATLLDGSLAVAVARFAATTLTSAHTGVQSTADSYQAGAELARQLANPQLRGVLVFSDGLQVNGSELLRGLTANLPLSVVISGGLAGDADRFRSTWVIIGGRPHQGAVAVVGLHGNAIRIGHGSKGGWDVFGIERTVTRSAGNVLYELDGQAALQIYKQYLGERAAGLPATALLFPLALRLPGNCDKTLVRTILGVDEAAQSMTFAGDIPQGSRAKFMQANFDRLIEGAAGSALMTRHTANAGESPCLSIAVSCVGRRLVLGERTEEELESVLDVLPHGSQQVGFYSYGEISPYASGGCDLHNQTMTLTTLVEV